MPDAKGFGGRKERRSEDAVSIGSIVDDLCAARCSAGGCRWRNSRRSGRRSWASASPRETAPVAFDEGVLTVGVSTGPWGAQATFLAEQIRLKADEALGGDRVTAIRIIVRNRS